MGGIIAAIHLSNVGPLQNLAVAIAAGLMLLLVAIMLKSFSGRWVYGLLAIILFFITGFFAVKLEEKQLNKSALYQYQKAHKWIVETMEPPVEKENSYKMEVKVLRSDSFTIKPVKAVLYLEKDSVLMNSIAYRSQLIVYTQWQRPDPPLNPSQFNYRQYLERQGITHQAYAKAGMVSLIKQQKELGVKGIVFRLRGKMLEQLKAQGFSGDELSLASAILLGQDQTMDPRLRSGFATAGAMHILCVSGLHVGVIFLILSQMLGFLNKRKHGPLIKALLLIVMIWFYAALTGLEPSVLRASTMISFVIIGQTIRRKTSVYNSLAASALLLLIINPLIITQIGFQLSYLAVLSIVAFQPVFYQLWLPYDKILDRIWAITTVSLAAQLGTFPLALHYFHIFPVYFLLTNLIVIPLSSLIIYSGFLFFLTGFFAPLSWLFGKMLWAILWFLKQTVFMIESFPSASVDFLNLSVLQLILLYASILLAFVWIAHKNRSAATIALALILVLMVSFVGQGIKRVNQKEFVVYSSRSGLAAEVVMHPRHWLMMDSLAISDSAFIPLTIKEYWIQQGLDEPEAVVPIRKAQYKNDFLEYRQHTLAFNEKLVYFLQDELQQLAVSPDILVVHHQKALPQKALRNQNPKQIVLSAIVPPWNKEKWLLYADSMNLNIHCLSDGAYRLPLPD